MTISQNTEMSCILLNGQISLADAAAIANHEIVVELSAEVQKICAAAHDRLLRAISENRHVYGITTGFGPLANRLIDPDDGVLLQQNLVNHLASGIGEPFDWAASRAIVLARLMSIIQGASGASARAIEALLAVINSPFAPVIPTRGTVGASGDLTPLAHMVLCLQGRGQFVRRNGEILHGPDALREMSLVPLDLSKRDGLALVNGTSAMTGIALLNSKAAGRALAWSVALSAAMGEVLQLRAEAWDRAFAEIRPHTGQRRATQALQAALVGSRRLSERPIANRRLSNQRSVIETDAGQDAYTLRCAPQVIGAVWDTALWHDGVVQTELCSVTDNPIFPQDCDSLALHGGNFMGQHVALASDAMAGGVQVLANLAERQIARITDERLNGDLPAFLHQGPSGLNSGLMGAQVTATAVLAEMRSTGGASIHSISTNGANQDVVSMGTIAARLLAAKLKSLSEIHAILALSVAQAINIRQKEVGALQFSPKALALVGFVRAISAELIVDRPLGQEIEELASAISERDPPETGELRM